MIYSPAITSGVSLTTEHFTRHVGIFTGVIKVNDILQMMGRDRTAKDWLLAISSRSYGTHSFDMEKALADLGEAPTLFSKLKNSTDSYEKNARNGLICLALNILKLKGHRLHMAGEIETNLDSSIKKLSSKVSKEISEERLQSILEQAEITESEYRLIRNKWLNTQEEASAIYAYQIRNYLCSGLSEGNIKFMDGDGLKKVSLFETIHADDSDIRRFDSNEKLSLDPSQRYYAAEKKRVYQHIIKLLGLNEEFEGEFTHKESQEVVSYFLENYDLVNQLFPEIINKNQPPRCATSFVVKLFEMIGIQISKRKSNGRMIRFIGQGSVKNMQQYRKSRSEKDKSFIRPHEDPLAA